MVASVILVRGLGASMIMIMLMLMTKRGMDAKFKIYTNCFVALFFFSSHQHLCFQRSLKVWQPTRHIVFRYVAESEGGCSPAARSGCS